MKVRLALALALASISSNALAKSNDFVQLGAFSILSNATSYWNRISDQVDFMDKDPSIEDSKLHILRVYGYTASQANNVCKQVKAYGENCLVRHQ